MKKEREIEFNRENDIIHISIIITGRCNANCEYCHYYAAHSRDDVNSDMDFELFKHYISVIKYMVDNKIIGEYTYRFSGGDPLVMGNKLFKYTDYAFSVLGKKPYILTNGKGLNKNIINKSKNHNIGAYIVSIENPFKVSKGAVKPEIAIEKIIKYNNDDLPVLPGVIIVTNDQYSNLFHICNYIYDRIGILPTISEMTFYDYERPTDEQLDTLTNEISKIIIKYFGKTHIELFPYIIPEINTLKREFLLEMNLEGTSLNLNENMIDISNQFLQSINKNYKEISCKQKCECSDFCSIQKWLWTMPTPTVTKEQKQEDYCKLKKAIYKGIVNGISKK